VSKFDTEEGEWGMKTMCETSYKKAQEERSLRFEFSELAGYTTNGVLLNIYSYAFASGFEAGYEQREKERKEEEEK